MSANSFGQYFKLTSFGESHGNALGVVIEGVPSGLEFKEEILADFLKRRRPGLSELTSARNETDEYEILSGVFDGKSLGTPIAVIVKNKDARSQDYDKIKNEARKGHADDVWKDKFGHTDHRGGGRSSGRETVSRVIAGAFAKMLVQQLSPETDVMAYPKSIGEFEYSEKTKQQINEMLLKAKEEGQSYGGVAEVKVQQTPKSLGQPVFRKIKSDLAQMCMSLGAVQGFELGDGFAVASKEGVAFHSSESQEKYGGIRGGITTGEPIVFRAAFKPTSSVLDVAKQGRHDPCVLLRALVVLEAMTWIVLADHMLWRRQDTL